MFFAAINLEPGVSVFSRAGNVQRGYTHEGHKMKLSCGLFDAMPRQQNPHIALTMHGFCFLALRQKSSQAILHFMPLVSIDGLFYSPAEVPDFQQRTKTSLGAAWLAAPLQGAERD